MTAEIDPSIFRNRYPRDDRKLDEQDASCVVSWRTEVDEGEVTRLYFESRLTNEEPQFAEFEGSILAIMYQKTSTKI